MSNQKKTHARKPDKGASPSRAARKTVGDQAGVQGANPSTKRGRERYDKILDTAERLFSTRDYHEVSINEIGREAGGSLATLYKWFGSKDDLLFAILTRRLARVQRNIRTLEPIGEAVEADFKALIDFVFDNVPVALARAGLFGSSIFYSRRNEIAGLFAATIFQPIAGYVDKIAARRGFAFRFPTGEIVFLIVRYARGFFFETALSDENLAERSGEARAALLKLCLLTVETGEEK